MHRIRLYGLSGLMAALAACGGGGGEPERSVATSISVSPGGPVNVEAGTMQTLTATVLDQNGQPMESAITWSSSTGTVIVTPSGRTATVTGTIKSTGTVTATTGGVASAPVTVSIVSGPAFGLVKVLDLPNNTAAGTGDFIRVRVVDAFGNAVAGTAVTFMVTGGGGSVESAIVTSDGFGIAQTRWTTGTTVGSNTATASAPGLGSPIGFAVSTVAGTPAVVRVTSPQVVIVETGTTFTPTWSVRDAFGNFIPSAPLSISGRGVISVTSAGVVSTPTPGQGMVVARSSANPAAADSVLVVVAHIEGPVVRTDLASIELKTDTTFTVGIYVDMRSATNRLGSATLRIDWSPAQLTYQSDVDGSAGVAATVNSSAAAAGSLRMSLASPDTTGWTGVVEVRRITFRATSSVGVTGQLMITTSELATTEFVNLLPTTVSVAHPLKTR